MGNTNGRFEVPGFQVLEYLGSGARSTIWRVRQRDTGADFALKRVTLHQGDDGRFFEQVANEFEVARQLDHPTIRKVHKLWKVRHWLRLRELRMLMEICEGASCQAIRPTEIDQVLDVFLAVAQALAHMNNEGFIHADMKPNNIIVVPGDGVKIIDLGQSCPIGTVKPRIQGTPDFIAPEQVHRRPLDARTDVFNFGAAMYWILTGQAIPTAMPKGDGIGLVGAHMTPIGQLNPLAPSALCKLVMDCIEVQPSRRPPSCKEVASRLDLIALTVKRGLGSGPGPRI